MLLAIVVDRKLRMLAKRYQPRRSTVEAVMKRNTSGTRYLDRGEGRIAYDVTGEGPLVVCVPGMGDLRSVYRYLVPPLTEAGYRVVTMDIRGHGESDATFSDYDDVATGRDLIALAEELGGPAVLVGNSMGAGAAAWAAAEAPDHVAGTVLLGPFVRNAPVGRAAMLAFRLLLLKPWGPFAWHAYYAKTYPTNPPADLAEHRARIRESMKRPGYWRSFKATTHTTHAPVEARLGEITSPTLIVMGERDPDFKDPAGEARYIAERIGGEVVMVPGAGHYPQAEYPDAVAPALIRFLGSVYDRA
jgi:pimeloyl-ACP methyl ester carboxylesterase